MTIGKRFAIIGVTVIDGTGKEPRPDMSVTVDNGIISAVEKAHSFVQDRDLKIFDADGMFLLPGLIDTHIHLSGSTGDELEAILINNRVRTMQSVAHAQQILKAGFTSVRDISWNGLYLKRIFRKRILAGPRIVACGPGLSRRGGHSDIVELPIDFVEANHFWGILCDGEEKSVGT